MPGFIDRGTINLKGKEVVGELGLLGGADVGDALVVKGFAHTGEDAVGLGPGGAVGLLLGGGASVDVDHVGDDAEVVEGGDGRGNGLGGSGDEA